jgi:hypothetical protein
MITLASMCSFLGILVNTGKYLFVSAAVLFTWSVVTLNGAFKYRIKTVGAGTTSWIIVL